MYSSLLQGQCKQRYIYLVGFFSFLSTTGCGLDDDNGDLLCMVVIEYVLYYLPGVSTLEKLEVDLT